MPKIDQILVKFGLNHYKLKICKKKVLDMILKTSGNALLQKITFKNYT